MSLPAGTRLGPYEILSPLGAGGMGEVWRARDTRLDREIAIKVLPAEVAGDASRLKRFEKEARSASALNHPNIVTIHDIGSSDSVHWIAMEKVDGKTLREVLFAGALSVKKLLPIAAQIADGLARAHEAGIVHRDLKPENVMVTPEGLVKILDFGLAKLTSKGSGSDEDSRLPTETGTSPGVVVGTVGYMSPEQAAGQPVDFRSDQFSFGSIIYEMATGKRAFQKATAVDTLSAILHEEPKPVGEINPEAPLPLRWIVERCLTKEPRDRYASTRDLARDLSACRQHVSEATAGIAPPRPAKRKRWLGIGALALVLLSLGAGLFLGEKRAGRAPIPSFKRITFRRGSATFARFTPDFQSVVYGAAWGGKPQELFVQRLASADARSLGVSGRVLATAGGDVLVRREGNVLARLPLEGGTPRDLLKDVDEATWDRSGTRLAVTRVVGGRFRLEYPVGKVLVETTQVASIDCLHLSPDAERIAFSYHPNIFDSTSDICVVEKSGQKRTLSKGWPDMDDLAWSADGKEVWFSAARQGFPKELHAVTPSGEERLVARFPATFVLGDISPDGRVLLSMGERRRCELRGRMAGDTAERDLSWLDGTIVPLLAPDGKQMVFQEGGEGGGPEASTYHWRMDGSAPKRLGDGTPYDVSPDWKTVLVGVGIGENIQLKLVPIGPGEAVTLPRGPVHTYLWGYWHPDGKRIVILGSDAEGQTALFMQDVAGGLPRFAQRLAGRVHTFWLHGRSMPVKLKEDGPWLLYPIDGGESRPLPFVKPEEEPIVFSDDGKSLFVTASPGGKFPVHLVRVDLKTGRRDPWLELSPPDPVGVVGGGGVVSLTPNGCFYAYHVRRNLSDLYVVEGLK